MSDTAYQLVEIQRAAGAPKALHIAPPIAGPMTCVMFIASAFSALALLRFSRPTRSSRSAIHALVDGVRTYGDIRMRVGPGL